MIKKVLNAAIKIKKYCHKHICIECILSDKSKDCIFGCNPIYWDILTVIDNIEKKNRIYRVVKVINERCNRILNGAAADMLSKQ